MSQMAVGHYLSAPAPSGSSPNFRQLGGRLEPISICSGDSVLCNCHVDCFMQFHIRKHENLDVYGIKFGQTFYNFFIGV